MGNKSILIWIGKPAGSTYEFYNCEVYNCQYYLNLKDISEFMTYWKGGYLLEKLDKNFDHVLIHFDGLYMDFLEDMVARGLTTNHYEIRIHDVDEGQANFFYAYRNRHWLNQEGWFKRGVF